MSFYTYQNKAWAILEKKLEILMKEDETGKYAEMKKLMSESASEAFKKETKSEDVADLFADAVNSSMFNNEAFAKQLTNRTHRTLQQSAFRAFKACVDGWAENEKEGWYDMRNEATVKASVKVKEALKDDYFPLV